MEVLLLFGAPATMQKIKTRNLIVKQNRTSLVLIDPKSMQARLSKSASLLTSIISQQRAMGNGLSVGALLHIEILSGLAPFNALWIHTCTTLLFGFGFTQQLISRNLVFNLKNQLISRNLF